MAHDKNALPKDDTVIFVEDCGHHKAGDVEDVSYLAAKQYVASGKASFFTGEKEVDEPKKESKKPAPKK